MKDILSLVEDAKRGSEEISLYKQRDMKMTFRVTENQREQLHAYARANGHKHTCEMIRKLIFEICGIEDE